MDWQDRGLAVAMSLGGKAGKLAKSMPHDQLTQPGGLHLLLSRLEQEYGAELQDRVRHARSEFKSFSRQRGQNAVDYILEFERRYSEAIQYGLVMSQTLLTIELLERAMLTSEQEAWVLQVCAGDLTQYTMIRRALKRLPSLDSRHTPAGAGVWVADTQQAEASQQRQSLSLSSQVPVTNTGPNPYNVFAETLNAPPPSAHEHVTEETWLADDDDDSDSDDDYVSSCPSNADDKEQENLVQAFAIMRRKISQYRKSSGKRFYRKGFRRTKKAWAVDTRRNDSDVVPPGWTKEKWLARTKCPGCGSRWHRDCRGAGKTFAIIRKKGHKGGHKGKSGGKSGHEHGKGPGNTWAIFPVFQHPMMCQPCSPSAHSWQ